MNHIKPIISLISLFFFSIAHADVQSHFEQIKNDPNALYTFFKSMPKGGELHYHLAGGAYPETMLELASKGDYCLNTTTGMISKDSSNCKGMDSKNLFNHPEVYVKTIRNWSLQDFVPGKESAHDHFFNSFYKFNAIVADHQAELVADVLETAAQQNEQYMELMVLPDNAQSIGFGALLKNTSSFSQKRQLLLAINDFQKNINFTATEANRILQQARQDLGCDINPEKKPLPNKSKILILLA